MSKKEIIDSIIEEAEVRGLAFVEDDFIEDSDGIPVYNPMVDNINSLHWLREKLNQTI